MADTAGGSEFERARDAADERRLVKAAAEGSVAAFERLYRNHVGKVYGLCLRMTTNPTIAEDCAQDAFVQAWRNLPGFENRSSFGTWLHRIAVNVVLAGRRRHHELLGDSASVEDTLAEVLPDRSATDPGAALDLEQAIAGLPARAREVLVLVGIYGYSHEDAASMLGIAVGTCKSQLHRARQLLGTRLSDATEVR